MPPPVIRGATTPSSCEPSGASASDSTSPASDSRFSRFGGSARAVTFGQFTPGRSSCEGCQTRRGDSMGCTGSKDEPAATAPGRRTSPGVLYGIGDSTVASSRASGDDLEVTERSDTAVRRMLDFFQMQAVRAPKFSSRRDTGTTAPPSSRRDTGTKVSSRAEPAAVVDLRRVTE